MWSRNEAFALAPHTNTWPTVNDDGFEQKVRADFLARKEAIRLYFAGDGLETIEKKTGICYTELPRLARKCLTMASDGQIFGFRALIPYVRMKPYTRKVAVGYKRPEQQGGQAGALGQILRTFPELEDDLIKRIRQDAKQFCVPEYRLRPRDLHRIFISFLKDKIKENKLPPSAWPFNTKYRGVRSIQKYMEDLLLRNFARTVNIRGEKAAKAHLHVGTGEDAFLLFSEPYDVVEIDAYSVEALMSVSFRTPEGTETELLLERLWYLAAVDRASTAILAHSVVYRSEVTSDDVLHLIQDATTKKWTPMELTLPGIAYPAHGGIPSGVIPEAFGAVWSVTMLDGALVHLASKIRERARKLVGYVLNWGAVGRFERRPNVERTFRKIGQDIIRRLPSTTGSHPYSGRAPDAEKKAVVYKIRAEHIEQLLDVYAALHNVLPSEGISQLTPLEFIRYFLEGADPISQARKLPMAEHESAKKFACTERKTVRGSLIDGRRPYVQIDRVHYTSPILAEAGHLIRKTLIVEIDEDDMRQVRAFLENGAELGFLKAQGRWSLTKHSRRTRKAINSLLFKRIIAITEYDDPMQVYLQYLATPTKPLKKNKSASLTPRQATDATRVAKESGLPRQIQPVSKKTAEGILAPRLAEMAARKSLFDTSKMSPRKAKNRR